MGNCMETCTPKKEEEEKQRGGGGGEDGEVGGFGKEGGGFKVKIMLTRGELEWLMVQMKEKGERRLEDVLMEISKGREGEGSKAEGWKPTLESIMESPEVQCFDVAA